MATCTERLPFTLVFEQVGRPGTVSVLYEREDDVPESDYVIVRENLDLKVLFQSSRMESRLYLEGLEGTSSEEDERGSLFLRPNAESRLVYRHAEFPLIPGDYLVRVACGGASYYTMMRVVPKQMSVEQLELMKKEIDAFMKGLGRERVRQRPDQWQDLLSPVLAAQLRAAERHYKSVLPAAADLRERAAFRLGKEYRFVAAEDTREMDEMTIRHYLRYPERRERLVPAHQIDYDVPENRWLKRTVKQLQQELGSMLESLQEQQIELPEGTEVIRNMRKLQKSLHALRHTGWLASVQEAENTHVPHSIHFDARYRAMLQLQRDLRQVQHREAGQTETRWRRTDKLYEIWGFIQFVQLLWHQLGFHPVSGWVFSGEQGTSLPALTPNTRIDLEREEIRLQLYYEGELPLEHRTEQVLYIEGPNNRPDMRLDVFQSGMYIGSLLFDFKYRPLHHIWDVRKVRNKIPVMKQLTNYAMLCRSCCLYGEAAYARFVRPVHEVWAIHPNQISNYPDSQKYELHDARIVRLSPGDSHMHVAASLQTALEELQEKARAFMK
ncbi:DUF2357 domain-containing protein [Ectobacillus ponti]|uniref:DUF2357 domain-containing protein n=1 Tax=Ectobacillus ponti TaxID=2961894 RepID=A0AA41XD39_9BACI|nr:DUF2357 domain-containing protein [Ectobacillus ponti]MCP8969886.1 DUF2357 domain-containing protein [Ectobacillus ponti]